MSGPRAVSRYADGSAYAVTVKKNGVGTKQSRNGAIKGIDVKHDSLTGVE